MFENLGSTKNDKQYEWHRRTEIFFRDLKIDLEECFTQNTVVQLTESTMAVDDVLVKFQLNDDEEIKAKKGKLVKQLLISWTFDDELLGSRVLAFLTPTNSNRDF